MSYVAPFFESTDEDKFTISKIQFRPDAPFVRVFFDANGTEDYLQFEFVESMTEYQFSKKQQIRVFMGQEVFQLIRLISLDSNAGRIANEKKK